MHQLSSDVKTTHNKNSDESSPSIGTANTLKRAMTVEKLDDMLDCIKDMKFYANTIEKDLPDYLDTIHIDKSTETNTIEFDTDDYIQQAQQRLNDNRYILLQDLINQKTKSDELEFKRSTMNNPKKTFIDKQVEYMKGVIAAQPSALEAIYLEALLNPDQWQYNHQLLQTSPMDILTSSERKRLEEILNETYH